jgi:hypothetical protein
MLPNYNNFFAAGLGTLWARQWEPAEKFEGRELLSIPLIKNLAFWHVQIRLIGEAYVPVAWVEDYLNNRDAKNPPLLPGMEIPLPQYPGLSATDGVGENSDVALSRLTASMLKVRMLWKDVGGFVRCIDFDLGSGVDIITPPAHYVQLKLLLPVVGSELQVPTSVATNPQGFATRVAARADCVPNTAEREFQVRYTDTVYLLPPESGESTVRIPRKKMSKRMQASSNDTLGPTRAIWNNNPPGTAPTDLRTSTLAVVDARAGAQSTPIEDIPGMTNEFHYQLPDGLANANYTLVQEMSF